MKDRPFMWVFGWQLNRNERTEKVKGRVYAFPHDADFLTEIVGLASTVNLFVGHNVKYDLHMVINGGVKENTVYSLKNVVDTMGLCRLSFDAVSARDGGDFLGLKKVSVKYIDPRAGEFEKEVKKELGRINNLKRKVLLQKLKAAGWTMTKLKDAYKVKQRNEMDYFTKERKQRWLEVPKEIEEMYFNWMDEYPFANYSEVDKDIMIEYVHSDGIYTLEVAELTYPTVLKRKQTGILQQENELIMELLRMERVGMKVDMDYLNACFITCDTEIQRLYEELWKVSGRFFTASQGTVLQDYFEEKLGQRPAATDKAFLKKHIDTDRVAQIITRLRRLEKWQSTYISRIREVAEYDGHFYTQYMQFNTVSGRLGSDAQQFPKERILTEEGEAYEKEHGEGSADRELEIFFPRRAFIPEGGKYDKIAYFDLSQIELRVQANYTILLGRPDKNLCRAYMPFECTHYKTGEIYKFESVEDRGRWSEKDEDGNSAWVKEDGERWTPTDVHSETSHNTLLALGYECEIKYKKYTHKTKSSIDEKSFKKYWRYIGKMFNFMRYRLAHVKPL
ncbi:DNA polymerase [Alkalihalobacillus sp. NPDC078783]